VWRPVIQAAANHGLAPIAGSAADISVVGFLTRGGIGPLARTFGVSSDWVRGFDVVTGDGELRHVTAQKHRDLFWGLRGGMGTLGVVCAAEIELIECTEVYGGAIYYAGGDIAPMLDGWARWARELPDHANTSVALLNLPPLPSVPSALAGQPTVAVRFTSVESAAVCEPLLAEIRELATPLIDTVTTIPYTDITTVHAYPTAPIPTSQATALLHHLPDTPSHALHTLIGPRSHSPQAIVELQLLGGAYARPAADPSAVCHRDACATLTVIESPGERSLQGIGEHAEAILDALRPWASSGMLPNFAASADAETIRRCYDNTTLVRLSALADRYDPAGVFRVGQVVRGF
jgi:FAD binding domain